MCGRCACSLEKDKVIKACTLKSGGNNVVPIWLDLNAHGSYQPSYNMCPSSLTPVLTTASHWDVTDADRTLVPMSWGLVPSWHKGDPKEFSLKTINCRVETILEKPTFKVPLRKGQRCIVVAEGYFEWKSDNGNKQPYLVYFPQAKGISMTTRNWEKEDNSEDKDQPWNGPKLLTMAGIFEKTILQNEEQFLSYSIITKSSSPIISWLHSRMPAVIDGEENISMWLDNKNVSMEAALKLLERNVDLEWHPVSSKVGNVRNKDVDCVLPIKIASAKKTAITNWFKPAKTSLTEKDLHPIKKPKKE